MAKESSLWKYLLGTFLIGSALFASKAEAKISSDNTFNFGAHNESTLGRKNNGYGYIFDSKNQANLGNYLISFDIEAYKKTLYVQNSQNTRVGKDDVDNTNIALLFGLGNKTFSAMIGPYITFTNASLKQDIVAIDHKTNASGLKGEFSYKGLSAYGSVAYGNSRDNVEINLPAPLEKSVSSSETSLQERKIGIEKDINLGILYLNPKIEQTVETVSSEKSELKGSLEEWLAFDNINIGLIQQICNGKSGDKTYDAFFFGGGVKLKW